ncbi:MAG: UDP-N-acetylmuramoyl-L-alanyl-D-glutamate--2,6-diaminopimelate ligase, partial [Deltaproteobacteria bacterium]|nr:UDP-N-acetylmuramoyl-L-alanyl-D-glutamate--2,6-diaminopimelate ligase [Deltaproteobacteria bacterium]
MKKLSTLLENIEFQCESSLDSIEIEGITYDSRKVRPGSLFVAMKGEVSDGHHYIPQAIEQGAAAIVGEDCCKSSVPLILVKNSRAVLAQLAKKWFEDPSASIDLVGVTGTNGKTTLTYLIE